MGWMDSVKRTVDARVMSVEQGRMIVWDADKWRAVVNVGMESLLRLNVSHVGDRVRCEEGLRWCGRECVK